MLYDPSCQRISVNKAMRFLEAMPPTKVLSFKYTSIIFSRRVRLDAFLSSPVTNCYVRVKLRKETNFLVYDTHILQEIEEDLKGDWVQVPQS